MSKPLRNASQRKGEVRPWDVTALVSNAIQRLGRNQPERIRAFHRQGNTPEQSRIRAEARAHATVELLHGQEHARSEGLHHGKACRAAGGVILSFAKRGAAR